LDLVEEKFFIKKEKNNSSEKNPKIFISNDLEKITKFLFENSEKQ